MGAKGDDVGWEAFKICQNEGALIAMGHEHSYSRTKTLDKIGQREHGHGAKGRVDQLELAQGQTFAFVNGLGGASLREYFCEIHDSSTWWASIFSENYHLENGEVKYKNCEWDDDFLVPYYTYGVLFITFRVDGDTKLAKGEFKTIEGRTVDSFKVRTLL